MKIRAAINLAVTLLIVGLSCAQAPSSRNQRLRDLATLRVDYIEKTLALTPERRGRALRLLSELEQRANRLSAASFLVGVYEVAAIADNAHDTVSFRSPAARPALRASIRLIWFPEGLVIARGEGQAADLAGGRVSAVEGRKPETLFSALRRLCGGTDLHCKVVLPGLIESGGILHSLGLAAAPDRLRLTVEMPDGRRVDRTIPMVNAAAMPEPPGGPARFWSPASRLSSMPPTSQMVLREIPLDGLSATYSHTIVRTVIVWSR